MGDGRQLDPPDNHLQGLTYKEMNSGPIFFNQHLTTFSGFYLLCNSMWAVI